ncbi:MAG: glycosyl transferase [Marinilabiliales bacterium]|nr:MAG: glycosyl transferase [Marinilabiliales bacterium]
MQRKLSILIPVYNEDKTITKLLDKVLSVELIGNFSKEILVINDNSSDNTRKILEEYIQINSQEDIKLFNQDANKGKGAALHTGIKMASGSHIVIQDADLEYNPAEYNILLQPVVDGFADVVYGSRFMGGNPHRILFFWHSLGNKFLTSLSNMLTNLNLTDMETCYKLFEAKTLKKLSLHEKRFGFEPEVTAKISKVPGIRIYEVGISYYGRTYVDGKKIGWQDGLHAIYCILKYNLFS